jgi:antiviral helicase SKI2
MELLNRPYDGEDHDYSSYVKYSLSDFQKWAFLSYDESKNILLCAHTGSGKTLIAEYAILREIEKGKRVIYTSPIKALTNQKFHEFRSKYPHLDVGIITGDIKYNPTGNVLLMTTEILLNILYKGTIVDPRIGFSIRYDIEKDFSVVVFDEVHYINDAERGHVWEESLILLPKHIQLILLSATLGNPEEFAEWIAKIRERTCVLIPTSHRVVPLHHCLFLNITEKTRVLEIKEKETLENVSHRLLEFSTPENKFDTRLYNEIIGLTKKYGDYMSEKGTLNSITGFLQEKKMLPAIYFVFSRNKAMQYAKLIEHDLLDSSETVEVEYLIKEYLRKLPGNGVEYRELAQYYELVDLLKKGIAYHHSGLVTIFKEIIELLYSKGLVRVLVATETFAVGVNMPTKTVVMTAFEKPSGDNQWKLLQSHEYLQMAGRAGRRGIDTIGHVILLPNMYSLPNTSQMSAVLTTGNQRITSKLIPDFALVLHVLEDSDKIKHVFSKSMLSDDKLTRIREIEKQIADIKIEKDYSSCLEYEALLRTTLDADGLIRLSNATIKKNQLKAKQMMTPEFSKEWDSYKTIRDSILKLGKLKTELDYLQKTDELLEETELVIEFLDKWGYVKDRMLTLKGRMAECFHECNPILMVELIENGFLNVDSLQLAEILSIFCESRVFIEDVKRSRTFGEIEKLAAKMENEQLKFGFRSKSNYI